MPAKILLATRLPEGRDATAEAAARLADEVGGEVVAVYVAVELAEVGRVHLAVEEEPETMRQQMTAEIEARMKAYLESHFPGRSVQRRIVEGDVGERIAELAREMGADYLVVGTEGRSTLSQVLLGSTSQKILQSSPCPVLVVPPGAR